MEPIFVVKISISFSTGYGTEDVVYYRYNVPFSIVQRYRWYFDYLAALLKVRHPRRRVELTIGRNDGANRILCGTDYVEYKRPLLLSAKKRTISKIRNKAVFDDLFGFSKSEREDKIGKIKEEIDALERGEFHYYVFPTYINKVKQWTKEL